MNVYAMSCGQGDAAVWKKASERTSLRAGFRDADPDPLIAWEKRMGELVQMDTLEKLIHAGRPVSDARGLLTSGKLTPIQKEWLEERLTAAGYGDRMRLNYYVGKALGGAEGERYISHCFQAIQEAVLDSAAVQRKEEPAWQMMRKECTVKLPLRLNWGGGWSDTPPLLL